jgi:RecJ-like exonuclease
MPNPPADCPRCKGRGWIVRVKEKEEKAEIRAFHSPQNRVFVCNNCHGKGKIEFTDQAIEHIR